MDQEEPELNPILLWESRAELEDTKFALKLELRLAEAEGYKRGYARSQIVSDVTCILFGLNYEVKEELIIEQLRCLKAPQLTEIINYLANGHEQNTVYEIIEELNLFERTELTELTEGERAAIQGELMDEWYGKALS